MTNWISRLRGTFKTIFGIGGPVSGINIKADSGVMQARNAADSDWAHVQGQSVRLNGSNATNYVALKAPDGLAGSFVLALPSGFGSTGQVLETDGSGNLSWGDGGSGGGDSIFDATFDEGDTTVTIFTPGDNDVITKVVIVVDQAALSGSPGIIVGISGDTDKYVEAGEVSLLHAGQYVIDMRVDVGTSPGAIIATVTASGQTFNGRIYVERDPA